MTYTLRLQGIKIGPNPHPRVEGHIDLAWNAPLPNAGDHIIADGTDPQLPAGHYTVISHRPEHHISLRGLHHITVNIHPVPPDPNFQKIA